MPVRTRTVTELMGVAGHEQVVFGAERDVGLRAIIAIHSTALGPSLGGIRFWRYENERDALVDVLALSHAMTRKASIAGLHQGGGKAVVFWDDPEQPRSRDLLHALGRAIDDLGGRYLAAEDVGATTADMDGIAEVTPWVTGVDVAHGGSGDPSPVTAFGVLHAMRAVVEHLDGGTLRGRRVVVQGAGHVGTNVARLLAGEGGDVVVSDLYPERAHEVASAVGATVVAHEEALATPCDIVSPNALGGVLDDRTISQLRCRAVVGAANNQLGATDADRALAARGILFAPDFVVSAGGIINLAEEFTGYDRDRALARAAGIGPALARVLAVAAERGVTPQRAAEDLADARVAEEGRGRRWRPGDPAAWTNGAPLTTLRP